MSEDIKIWSSQCQEFEGCGFLSRAPFWTFTHPAHVDDLQRHRRESVSKMLWIIVQAEILQNYENRGCLKQDTELWKGNNPLQNDPIC